MKPRICIILTPDGIDSISVLSASDPGERKEGYKFCSYIESEITDFERVVCGKLKKIRHGYLKNNGIKE